MSNHEHNRLLDEETIRDGLDHYRRELHDTHEYNAGTVDDMVAAKDAQWRGAQRRYVDRTLAALEKTPPARQTRAESRSGAVSPLAASMLDRDPERAARILSRAIEDALTEALPAYWRRRADVLAAVGTSWADAAALACRRHAALLDAERGGVSVLDVLTEGGTP